MSALSTRTGTAQVRLYDDDAENLLKSDQFPDRVTLLPGQPATSAPAGASGGGRAGGGGGGEGRDSIRILWGQDLLNDLIERRYRTVVCGVNDQDNGHGIIAQLVELMQTSQWTAKSVSSYAKMFQESVGIHAAADKEPFVLKFDLDSLLILAILRPKGRAHFTLDDLSKGFRTVAKMLSDRRERLPAACVSFLNAKANRLIGPDGREPSFESVLRTMHTAGFRGDVYTAPSMWKFGHIGVFPSFPFPEGLERMRAGSS